MDPFPDGPSHFDRKGRRYLQQHLAYLHNLPRSAWQRLTMLLVPTM